MPKSSLARRATELAASNGAKDVLARLDDLGLTEPILKEAIEFHINAMRNAVSTRGAIDWTARGRSADVLIALRLARLSVTDNDAGARGPLVSLTLVAPPHAVRATSPAIQGQAEVALDAEVVGTTSER